MSFELRTGDVTEQLRAMPSASVQVIVTSPPYWMQRDYGVAGQLGQEATPELFAAALVAVFEEARRVLRDDGLCFVNLGTTYVGGNAPAVGTWKEKDAVPNAWLFGLAAREAGWYLRSEIIWEKINPKPSSVTDRFALVHETIVLLSKLPQYFSDMDAVREPYAASSMARRMYADNTGDVGTRHGKHGRLPAATDRNPNGSRAGRTDRNPDKSKTSRRDVPPSSYAPNPQGRIRKSVWRTNAPAFADDHFATYPDELVEPMVRFATSEAGCCSVCFAPIARVIEKGEPLADVQRASGGDANGTYLGKATKDFKSAKAENASDLKRRTLASMVERKTIGWRPTCACWTCLSCDGTGRDGEDVCFDCEGKPIPPTTVPCTVLDPFSGSGTTGVVALKNGRRYIGIELNPEYQKAARRRLVEADAQPPFTFARVNQEIA